MSDHHYILCIETSTPVCSVAMSCNGEFLARKEANEPNIHAAALTVFIEELLQSVELSLEDMSAIAVSKGPGSYTGLRIGVSVAKGLCYALDLPLIAIDTLEMMAHGFADNHASLLKEETVLCPMIDARRMEVYMAIFTADLVLFEHTSAVIVDEATFDRWTSQGKEVVLFGTGADKLTGLFEAKANVTVVEGFVNSAAYMCQLVFYKLNKKQFEDMAYFEPFYLKDFVATTPKKRIL